MYHGKILHRVKRNGWGTAVCGLIRYATQPPDGHKADAAPSLAISLAYQVIKLKTTIY